MLNQFRILEMAMATLAASFSSFFILWRKTGRSFIQGGSIEQALRLTSTTQVRSTIKSLTWRKSAYMLQPMPPLFSCIWSQTIPQNTSKTRKGQFIYKTTSTKVKRRSQNQSFWSVDLLLHSTSVFIQKSENYFCLEFIHTPRGPPAAPRKKVGEKYAFNISYGILNKL